MFIYNLHVMETVQARAISRDFQSMGRKIPHWKPSWYSAEHCERRYICDRSGWSTLLAPHSLHWCFNISSSSSGQGVHPFGAQEHRQSWSCDAQHWRDLQAALGKEACACEFAHERFLSSPWFKAAGPKACWKAGRAGSIELIGCSVY